jgi:NAD(P)-dependent dehydrogenase (short-subunit alcohol dehydrogenase family)
MSDDRRIALITGGGGAIGSGMAAALIRDGWRIVLADWSREAAEATAAKLDASRVADIMVCDVCDEASVRRVVADMMARHGRIDGLATAAGGGKAIGPRRLFWETTREDWTLNLETHLISVMVTCQAVLPHMVARRSGVIVNTSSGAGLRGGPPPSRQKFAEVYAVAKAGVIAFTQSIALEFASYGIRANCIAPGRAENNRRPEAELREMAIGEEAREPGSSRMSPLGRFGKAEDMGEAAAYLMSERSGYVTGSVIDVSGGIRLH